LGARNIVPFLTTARKIRDLQIQTTPRSVSPAATEDTMTTKTGKKYQHRKSNAKPPKVKEKKEIKIIEPHNVVKQPGLTLVPAHSNRSSTSNKPVEHLTFKPEKHQSHKDITDNPYKLEKESDNFSQSRNCTPRTETSRVPPPTRQGQTESARAKLAQFMASYLRATINSHQLHVLSPSGVRKE
jgi:hypothetical protein